MFEFKKKLSTWSSDSSEDDLLVTKPLKRTNETQVEPFRISPKAEFSSEESYDKESKMVSKKISKTKGVEKIEIYSCKSETSEDGLRIKEESSENDIDDIEEILLEIASARSSRRDTLKKVPSYKDYDQEWDVPRTDDDEEQNEVPSFWSKGVIGDVKKSNSCTNVILPKIRVRCRSWPSVKSEQGLPDIGSDFKTTKTNMLEYLTKSELPSGDMVVCMYFNEESDDEDEEVDRKQESRKREKSVTKKRRPFRRDSSSSSDGRKKQKENEKSELFSESWVLLDEKGRSRRVSQMDVKNLLAGRSLEIMKPVPGPSLREAFSDKDLRPPGCADSPSREDFRGDETADRSLVLERKLGNLLMYYSSRTDLGHPLVRFYPLSSELINEWRLTVEDDSSITDDEHESVVQTVDGTSNLRQRRPAMANIFSEELTRTQGRVWELERLLEETRIRNAKLEQEIAELQLVQPARKSWTNKATTADLPTWPTFEQDDSSIGTDASPDQATPYAPEVETVSTSKTNDKSKIKSSKKNAAVNSVVVKQQERTTAKAISKSSAVLCTPPAHDSEESLGEHFTAGAQKENIITDYYQLLAEKTSADEQLKAIQTERNLLMENQINDFGNLRKLNLQLQEARQKITDLENVLKNSEKVNVDLNKELSDASKIIGDNQKFEILTLHTKIKAFQDTLAKKHNEVEGLQKDLTQKANELRLLQQTSTSKDEMIEHLKTAPVSNESSSLKYERKMEELRTKLERLRSQKTKLETEAHHLSSNLKENIKYIHRLEGNVAESEKKLLKAKFELSKSVKEMERQIQEIEEKYNREASAHARTNEKLKTIEQKDQEVQKELEQLQLSTKAKLESYESTLKKEKENYEEAQSKLEQHEEQFLQEANRFKQHLEWLKNENRKVMERNKTQSSEFERVKQKYQRFEHKYRAVKKECNDRTLIIEQLEKIIQNNQAQLSKDQNTFKEKVAGYEARLSDLEESKSTLKKNLQDTEEQKNALEKDIGNYFRVLQNLEKELAKKVVVELEERQDEKKDEPSKIEAEDKTIENITSVKVEEYKSKLAQYQVRVDYLERSLTLCGKSLSELQTAKRTNNELKQKNNEWEAEIKNLTRKIGEQEYRLQLLTRTAETNEAELKKAKNEECKTKEELQQWKTKHNQSEELSRKLQHSLECCHKENKDILMKKMLLREREVQKIEKDSQTTVNKLMLKLKTLEDCVAKLKKELAKRSNEISQLKSMLNASQTQNQDDAKENLLKIVQNKDLHLIQLQQKRRDDRLLVKELQGDLETMTHVHKTIFKMIESAKSELDRSVQDEQVSQSTAGKIERHLNLNVYDFIPMSGFRKT